MATAVAGITAIATISLSTIGDLTMSDFEETYKRNQEIIRKGKELLVSAKAHMEQKKKLYEQHGITPEAARRYLDSDHLTAQQKQEIKKQVQVRKEEFEIEIQQMQAQHKAENTHREHAKKPRIKRMV
jgi:hypothetical protein